jgi:hypothetical protein
VLSKPGSNHIRYIAAASSKEGLEYATNLLERRKHMYQDHGGGDCDDANAIVRAINEATVAVIEEVKGVVRGEWVKKVADTASVPSMDE